MRSAAIEKMFRSKSTFSCYAVADKPIERLFLKQTFLAMIGNKSAQSARAA
jgi:hypothetical protein